MKQTLLICGSHKDSIGVMLGNKLSKEYNIRYFSSKNSDIKCDITNLNEVKSMINLIKDQNIKCIINTAAIHYKIPSNYNDLNVERLSQFFKIKLVGLLNLVNFSNQTLKKPFYFIQIGGALKSENSSLAHYAMVNRAIEGYIKQLNKNEIKGFYLELGPIKDTHTLKLLFDTKTIKEWDKNGYLSTCEDVFKIIKEILNDKINPGTTIKVGNFGVI